jgi:hypothetical protein
MLYPSDSLPRAMLTFLMVPTHLGLSDLICDVESDLVHICTPYSNRKNGLVFLVQQSARSARKRRSDRFHLIPRTRSFA